MAITDPAIQAHNEQVRREKTEAAERRREMAMSAPVLAALGLPGDASPQDVLDKVRAIEDERKQAETDATNEAHALGELRSLLGLVPTATDDVVVDAIRELLQSPVIINNAILTRRLGPTLRSWAESFAAKQGIAALRTFIAASGPYDVRADEIVADLARERVRWSRGRLDFRAAMNDVARDHPYLATTYRRQMQRPRRTNGGGPMARTEQKTEDEDDCN